MLGYLTRMLPVAARGLVSRRSGALVSRLHRRVSLRQIDVNWHMNQAAYAEEFEWGRLDLLLRSGGVDRWRAAGVWPVVAEQRIVYRRELKPWASYVLDTRMVGIEGRLLCVTGHLVVGRRVHARNDTKLIFLAGDGVLAPEEVPAHVEGLLTEPLGVLDWQVTDEALAPA